MKTENKVFAVALAAIMLISVVGCKQNQPLPSINAPATPTISAPATSSAVVQTPAKMDTITLGLAAFQDVNSVMVGLHEGFFKEENIDLQIVRTDWAGSNEMLIGDKVNLSCAGETDVVNQNLAGQDTTIAFPVFYFAGGAMMYDPAKHPNWKTYKTMLAETGNETQALNTFFKQLVDDKAKIGVSYGGSEETTFLTLATQAGYNKSDFTMFNIAAEDLPPTLFSNSIDIMMAGIPQRLAVSKQGYASLLEAIDFPTQIAHAGFAARRSWIDANFDLAVRFQKAMFKTLDFIANNPDIAFPIIADSLKDSGTVIDVDQLKNDVWNKMEFFPASKEDYTNWTINPDGKYYWKVRFEDNIEILDPSQKIDRTKLDDLLYALKIVNAIK